MSVEITINRAEPVTPPVESVTIEVDLELAAYIAACLGVQASWKVLDSAKTGRDRGGILYDRLATALCEAGAEDMRRRFLQRVHADLDERVSSQPYYRFSR